MSSERRILAVRLPLCVHSDFRCVCTLTPILTGTEVAAFTVSLLRRRSGDHTHLKKGASVDLPQASQAGKPSLASPIAPLRLGTGLHGVAGACDRGRPAFVLGCFSRVFTQHTAWEARDGVSLQSRRQLFFLTRVIKAPSPFRVRVQQFCWQRLVDCGVPSLGLLGWDEAHPGAAPTGLLCAVSTELVLPLYHECHTA